MTKTSTIEMTLMDAMGEGVDTEAFGALLVSQLAKLDSSEGIRISLVSIKDERIERETFECGEDE